MNLDLKNRVALVAASSQGIGRATAEAFAAEGCRVAMCARNRQTLQDAAENIRKRYNAEVLAEAFDVTDTTAVQRFVARCCREIRWRRYLRNQRGRATGKGFPRLPVSTTGNAPSN